MKSMEIDKIDKTDQMILYELQHNSNQTVTKLAKALELPRTTVKNRITRMEKNGIIKGYKAVVDWEKLGYPLCNFFHLSLTYSKKNEVGIISEHLKKMPGVEEVHMLTGRWDIIAKIRMKHVKDMTMILDDPKHGLLNAPTEFRSESMFVIKTYKDE